MDKSTKYEEQEHQETTAPERTGLEIAVIGMAGRFPGAPDIHRFWENLKNGIESISFFSKEELEEAGVDPQLLDNPNYVRAKGILEGSEYFDAPFFGYLPVEAEIMDPQVRVFHECAWAALEDAGYVPGTYNGLIGIYAGAVDNLNWQVLNLLAGKETGAGETGGVGNAKVDPYSAYLLSSRDHLASRISYKLNLKGPSMLIQAACSTSLTTIDNGCRALLTGICDMVLAGGININYPQKTGFLHQEGMIYSSDGHCRVFDAKASGTVPAEAAGIAVLKRLEDAETDGDHIYAVIKGFAVNNDGMEKVGYTAPSVTGQANVIRDALRAAMVNPESIGYIETHGTGTHLGDPVEIDALKSAFHTDKKHFCAIGSVKANLGHTNCAAGIASFIKTALILEHGLIPPSLHFENPNPEIDFENSPFYVNTKLKEWKCERYPRRAGVSSFGIGGANVHMVLEEYTTKTFDNPGEKDYELILLSARTAGALEKATENLFLTLKGNPKTSLPDAAYTLQVGRKHFSHRRTAVGSTLEEVLDALAPGNRFKTRTYTITTRLEKKRPAVFLFPGQGAQYVAMGLDLYRKEPLFQRELDRCFKILNPLAGIDFKEILYPSTGDYGSNRSDRTNIIDQTEIVQPLIFAFEYALAALLMSWGIEPAAMVGHSIGEYTAACLAGVFALEDALELVALRGRLMQQMPTGAMLSAAMPEEQLKPLLTDDISLAAVNSPSRCVVSGPCDAIDAFETKIKAGGIECTRLHTSHAFHSRMMDPILEPFKAKIGAVRLNKPGKPYISNVSGRWVTDGGAMDPAYWVRHLRETVRFSDGVKLLLGKDDFVFIEVGPGNSLTTLVKQHEGTAAPAVVNLVRRPQEEAPDDRYLLDKIGQLWLYGISIDWPGFHRGEKHYRVPLPSYPFEGRRFLTQNNFFQMGSKLLAERSEMARKPHIADWFYVPLWEQAIVSPRKSAVKNDSFQWLVFADNSSLSGRLVEALETNGHGVSVVMAGAGFHMVKEKRYTLDPSRKDDYNTLFSRLAQSQETPQRILHLWNIDVHGEGGLEWVDRAMDLGFYSLLNIVTALDSAGAARDIRLDVVTSCLQEVSENERIKPERAAIPAALRTIRREYPYISCRCIDIIPPPPGDPQEDTLVENLFLEFSKDRPGAQAAQETLEIAAWRGANRWVQHYKPYRLEAKVNPTEHIREAGVYLVTGGLGGIGSVFARRLAIDFKARLILVGRSPFPPEKQWEEWLTSHEDADPVSARIRELREMLANGAQVMVSSADVSNLEEMRGVINAAARRFGPINGVIHAAGLPDYEGVIQRRTRQATDKILAAKVKGTLVLDYLLKDVDLDFAILCSSNSSILAPPGQVGYNAANAFQDAFAYSKAAGAPGVWISIAWGPWQVGMSMEAVKKQNRDAVNLLQEGISPSEGVDILYLLLEHRLSHAAICPVDLGAVIGKMDWREPGAGAPGKDAGLEKTGPAILSPRPGLSVEYAAPRNLLEQALADIWQPYFGLEKIGVHDNFFELGGDSLKGMTLVNRYNKLLGETAPVAVIFNSPTIAELADYFTKHYPGAAARIRQGDAAVIDRENTYDSIQPEEKKEYYELSYNQKRLWIIQQTDPANTSYNMVGFFLLRHHADGEAVRKTLVRIGRKHESFRTSFKEENGEPWQFIEENVEIPLEVMDISGLEEKEKESRRNAVLETEKRTPFDLSRAPLFRVKLVKHADDLWYFIFNMHHIIGDGWSNEILKKDFQHYYEAYRAGQEVNTEILPLQYRDFAAWQNRIIRDPGLKENAYRSWLNKLEKGFTPFHLPGDFERTKSNSTAAVYRVVVGNETRDRLHGLAAGNNTTLFIVMFTVFNWLLARFSGRADILCGIISAGREHMELQDIVGFFVNSLPVKIQVNTEEEFGDFLRRVDTEIRELFQYQSYPLELVLDEFKIAYPGVSVCFNMLNMPDTPAEMALENFAVGHIEDLGEAKFDLVLYAVDYKNGIILNWSYKETLFKSRTMEIIAGGYLELLNAVTSAGEEESTAKEE